MEIFAERLKELRNEKGLTQNQLAKELGLHILLFADGKAVCVCQQHKL